MTHRTSADYYAGIPQHPGRINPADLAAAQKDAWDEAYVAGWVAAKSTDLSEHEFQHPRNPYRASNVEGMNQ